MTHRCLIWIAMTIWAALMPAGEAWGQTRWDTAVSSCVSSNYYDFELCRLQKYMRDYPQSQLCDVYKYCFQDSFGLEHLLSDSASAARYIEYELAKADTGDWQRPLFYYPLLKNNYVRVDINFVRQGIIPIGTMVSAMLESVVKVDYDSSKWSEQWSGILQLLKQVEPKPLNFDEDKAVIDSLLQSGKYAYHHSKVFNQTYRQHYRIVRRDVFEKRLLPLIELRQKTVKQ